MATFRVTDPNTGRTIKLEGDSPPTEQELNQIFSQVGGQQQAPQQPQESSRLFGGALPAIGGTLGSLAGGAVGGAALGIPSLGAGAVPGAVAGSVAGGAAGTGAGAAIENVLQNLFGRQRQTGVQQVQEAGRDVGASGLSDLIFGGLGRLLGPAARGISRAAVKTGVPESGKAATRAFQQSVRGTGRELTEEIGERGVTGGTRSLVRQAQEGLTETEGLLQQGLRQVDELPDILSIVNRAKSKVATTGAKALKGLDNIVDDFLKRPTRRGKVTSFADLLEVRRVADRASKGKAATEFVTNKKQFQAALADEIREEIQTRFPNLAELIGDERFFLRLQESAGRRGARPLSEGNVLSNLFRGLFSPAVTTRIEPTARGVGQVGTAIGRPATQAGLQSLSE